MVRPPAAVWLVCVSVACSLAPAPAAAHDAPNAALAALDAQLQARPDDVDTLLRRAELLRREGQPARALADLERVAKLAPTRRELFLERGLARAARGEPAAAEKDLTRFLAAGPPSVAALEARAKIRESTKRLAPARADYDAALEIRKTPELYLARGRLDEALGALDRAAAGYAEGLREAGGAVTIRLALIRVEIARKRPDRAIVLINEVLAVAPVKIDWLLLRADAHAAAGRADAALRDRTDALDEANRAIARRPTDLTRLARARAHVALGRDAEAIRDLEIIVERSPGLDAAHQLLIEARSREAQRSAKAPEK